MKILFTLITLFHVCISSAGTFPRYVISTVDPSGENPVENIHSPISEVPFNLWQSLRFASNGSIHDTEINISGNEINLFQLRGGGLTIENPPAVIYYSIAELEGINPGTYNLNYYYVPTGSDFPPSNANASMFFVETISFNVLGVTTIDSSSKFSIALLIVLMLLSYTMYCQKLKN